MKLTLTPTKKSNSSTGEVDSSSTSDCDTRSREGPAYQADIPDLDPVPSPNDHQETLFWQPTDTVDPKALIDYIDFARRKHRMNEEQALAILQICKYKITAGKLLMQQYTPEIDEWTIEDKCLFEHGFKYYGKMFARIKQMLPDKTVGELVRYYYSWKKTRLHKSSIDKQERQSQFMISTDQDSDGDEQDSNTTSVPIPTKDLDHRTKTPLDQDNVDEQECCNCEVININNNIGPMHSTPKGILCHECYKYWESSGLMRPELYPSKSSVKKIKRPPKNISLDLDSLIAMNSYDNQSNSNIDSNEVTDPIEKLEDDIRQELSVIQARNQAINMLTEQLCDGKPSMDLPFPSLTSSYPRTNSNSTPTSTWTTEEILLAIQAFGKYGKDFQAVARIVGPTKTVADVETFFLECRERYQLDLVIELNSKPTNHNQRKQTTTNNELNSNRSNTNDIIFVN